MFWNLVGLEASWIYFETSERDRAVEPSSKQASVNILWQISGGEDSIVTCTEKEGASDEMTCDNSIRNACHMSHMIAI
jgi:hypothetical protein